MNSVRHVIFLRELQIFVGHLEAMLDGIDAGLCSVVRASVRPAMRCKLHARGVSFRDHEADIVYGIDVFLVVDDNLDEFRAEMKVLADRLAHFIARVGEEIFRRREVLFLRL